MSNFCENVLPAAISVESKAFTEILSVIPLSEVTVYALLPPHRTAARMTIFLFICAASHFDSSRTMTKTNVKHCQLAELCEVNVMNLVCSNNILAY